MPTQVRIFTVPRSLGETLAVPDNTNSHQLSAAAKRQIPRSIPELGLAPKKKMGVNEDKSYPGGTFAHQDKLPKLPIPDLASSCSKYLQALKPLQSPREHSDTRHAVQEFLKNEGPELQEKLRKYAEGKTSYIEQFCMSSFPRPSYHFCSRIQGTTHI